MTGIEVRQAAAAIAQNELALLALATPFLLFPGVWSPVGLAIIGVTWIARRVAQGRFSAPTAMDVPIILLLVMVGVSLIPSVDLDLSLNRAWIYVLGVALFYGMVNGLRSQRHLSVMGIGLVLAGLVVAMISLVGTDFTIGRILQLPALYDRLPPPLIRGLPGSGVIESYDLVNPRVVAGALAILLPVPVAYVLMGQGWKLRLACVLTSCVMFMVLLLTQAPQGLLGLAAALLVVAWWRSKWFLLPLPLAVGGLLAIVWSSGVGQAFSSLLSADEQRTLAFGMQSRVVNGLRGVGMIRDMPYTGVGLNTFPVVDGLYSFGAANADHAHNLLIQSGADLGIAGAVALLALLAGFGYTVWRVWRTRPEHNERALLAGVCGGTAAWLAYGLLDSITLGHKPAAALWVMLGVSAGMRLQLGRPDAQASPFPPRFSRRWIVAALVPVLALIAVIGLARERLAGAFYLNLGAMEAHRALAADSDGEVELHLHLAEGYLQQALRWNPTRARIQRVLEWISEGDVTKRWPRETAGVEQQPPPHAWAPPGYESVGSM